MAEIDAKERRRRVLVIQLLIAAMIASLAIWFAFPQA